MANAGPDPGKRLVPGRPSRPLDWGFITNWTLMSLVGLLFASAARPFIYPLIFGVVGGELLGRAAEGAILGLAVGLAQQLALPPHLTRRAGWSVATVIGWAVAWSFGWGPGWQLVGRAGSDLIFVVIGLIAGLLAGLGQWLLLRRQVERAGWWVVVSPLAWAIGLWLGMTVGGAFGWPLAGGGAGLIGGLALSRLQPQTTLPCPP